MEFHLEPSSQQVGLWNLYTQLTFCYHARERPSEASVQKILFDGLHRLAETFPWTAGQVVRDDMSGQPSDRFVIRPFQASPLLVGKDLTDGLPSFGDFNGKQFPISFLDENAIAPRNTLKESDESDPKPVFLLQASFIKDGFLLTFAGQHSTLDMVGLCEVIRLLSKACHDDPFTDEEVAQGNRDRRQVVPLLDEAQQQHAKANDEHLQATQSSQTPPTNPPSPSKNVWAYFIFPSKSLRDLKSLAMKSVPSTTKFVSTDDTLSAFVWQCVSRARMPHVELSDSSTFARTVDARRYMDVPSIYPGNLASKTYTSCNFNEIVNESLGVIASKLRQSIDVKTSDIAFDVRATATALSQPARDSKSTRRSRDLSKDIAFSSWSKLNYCYDMDFNLGLGKPQAVRRPAFAPPNQQPMEGLVYLMPKRPDGEIAVAICLSEKDMEGLKGDEEWQRYGTFVG